MNLLPYGGDAMLVELDDPAQVSVWVRLARSLSEVTEVVPGARTVLVRTTAAAMDAVRTALAEAAAAPLEPIDPVQLGPLVEIPVRYDGADLNEVARLTALDPEEVAQLHSDADYVVRFCGFSPGFAYLDGLDSRLHVPRRSEPRTSVPAGAVAVAGEFAAVYPRSSPGGWQLLGSTDVPLWDVHHDPPALLAPGTRVRFVAQ